MLDEKFPIKISTQALKRMPYYHYYLKELEQKGVQLIAAPALASLLNLNEVQVRKDLSTVSSNKGKPKSGFLVHDLLYNIEVLLGYHNVKEAILVGAGSLGKALLAYKGFDNYGMHILAGFDSDHRLIDYEINGKPILPINKIKNFCQRLHVQIGIITVPPTEAQIVCDLLVDSGIKAIWNFAPIHLTAPDQVLVYNENMAASLALISQHLQKK